MSFFLSEEGGQLNEHKNRGRGKFEGENEALNFSKGSIFFKKNRGQKYEFERKNYDNNKSFNMKSERKNYGSKI